MENYKEYTGKEVTIMLCSKCNTNCKHCYISYDGNRDVKELKEMIINFQKKGYEIDLNGAEILTDLSYLPFYKLTNTTSIMTNGLAIYQNPNILKLLKDNGINMVELSYHFRIHETISSISLKIVEEVINLCKKDGFEILLNTTITNENYAEIEDMCEKAYSLGASRIRFNNLINQGEAINNNLKKLTLNNNQIQTFFKKIKKVREKYHKDDLYIERSGVFGKDMTDYKSNFECPAGQNDIAITPDNNVYPCFFIAKKGFEIGRYEDGIIKIFKDFKCNRNQECFCRKVLNNM